MDSIGVVVTNNVDALLAMEANCVMYAPIMENGEEFSDIRTHGAPFVVGEIMGFGKTPEAAARARCWIC